MNAPWLLLDIEACPTSSKYSFRLAFGGNITVWVLALTLLSVPMLRVGAGCMRFLYVFTV